LYLAELSEIQILHFIFIWFYGQINYAE